MGCNREPNKDEAKVVHKAASRIATEVGVRPGHAESYVRMYGEHVAKMMLLADRRHNETDDEKTMMMGLKIRVTRWDDPIPQQKAYRATGVDKHGKFHDYSATNGEDAFQGCRDEIRNADRDDTIRVSRWDDSLAQQEIHRATGVDEHGGSHDYRATNENAAIQGCRDKIDEVNKVS